MAGTKTDSIAQIATLMGSLDLCMLTTHAHDGGLHTRPMSNNGEVEFDGDIWFFSAADTRKVAEIEAEPSVQVTFTDMKRYCFIAVHGEAKIVRSVAKKRALWLEELERWFDEGPESEEIVLIRVEARAVEYWNGEDSGEITLD